MIKYVSSRPGLYILKVLTHTIEINLAANNHNSKAHNKQLKMSN